ncbi:PDZ domain-containing protein 8 isoform X1 [Apis mellifera caucasica]|uniref:PDZ domain-containing protein 8 isoform X1 n=1 Tax=Apis mellifera TaxID=7460 RepID=A0A7M7L0A0_APIME|nr:PDZ domain-containing protein 8 isoform X1 [Apis mellifera]KAG6801976.1 PDZ domain-containing protein 8 isoform X1 [Apis mellifera caucasica]|eukprot:XP_026295635.1 PDZ domain-containing protein 8 isoform X1 [Apis mellifera]
MDIFEFICVSVITFMCGIICTIVLEFYFFKKFLEQAPLANSPKKSLHHDKAQLPKELLEKIQDEKTNSINISRQGMCQGNENLAINLTLQFLFNELRNAERVRLWLYRKLNNEFKELLTQSTTGKLLDSVQLRDLNLGSQFPTIKGLEVADSKIDADTGLLETLDLSLDLHYSGNFQLSIDVKMLLGKTAYMALQVKRISGRARLQFTRVPYTHWSLSFYSDPILELEVQSQFQGRQLQPQIISLITGQIRRAVRRKHTLPRYKMRYKPFFRRLNDEAVDLSEVANMQLIPGYLEVSLVEITRLNLGPNILNAEDRSQVEIYCTISIDSTPWVYLTQYTGVPYMVLDLIISKVGSQQLGVVFKQEFVPEIGHTCVLVETIIVGSPAAIAEMKKGDILIAVDGKKVSNMNQVAKFVKSAVQRRFIIRVERKYSKTDLDKQTSMKLDSEKISAERGDKKTLKIDSISNKGDTPSAEDSKIKFETQIKFSDLKDYENEIADKLEMGNKFFRRRKSSAHTDDTAQTPDTTPSRKISTTSNQSISSNSQFCFNDSYVTNISDLYYTTKEKEYASLITFEETRTFQIDSELQYLNIGVWGRVRGGEIHPKLLGYINVPMKLILAQCYTSSTGHYLKCHALLPPDSASLTTVHPKLQGYSGFDPTLCYGDILLSYIWESNYSNRHMLDMGKKENIEAIKTQPSLSEEIIEKKMHDFIRTHFHRATHCDFCTKKIWLKDAVQCRDCGMVCHKKCEVRCQASGMCGAESITTMALEADEIEPTLIGESGPEISLTSCEDTVQGATMMAMKASIANTLLGLKKAGSTSCLAPPASGTGLASRSLPPSPCASRKNSLVGGLGISPDLLEGAEPSVAAPLVAGDLDDGLMSRAKDTGKFLYKNLEPQERVEKINIMMGKLKTALDAETTSRLELSQSGEMDSIKLIAQSDLRVQALSVLLLHYCAGLQHAQEVLDRSQKNKES